MTNPRSLMVRVEEEHIEILDRLAKASDRSRAYVVRRLIEQAGGVQTAPPAPAAKKHEHKAVRKNAAHMDVCECGAVLGKDFTWRMP